MKLADFFVALGFDITGAPELKDLDKQLSSMMGSATKLLAIFASMTAAMSVMLNQTLNNAAAFRKFNAVTGLSVNELKSWEYAAKLSGTETDDLASSVKSLQEARANIMMGTGNVAPWQLLGIAPSENPFKTLKDIKERIKDLDPAIARSIVGQMGISEGVFAMLRLSNKEFDELEKKYQLTRSQQKVLNDVNIEWARFRFEVSAVKDRLISELVPALVPLIKGLQRIVGLFANFVQWLHKASPAAKAVKILLVAIIAGIVGMTVALTLLVGVLGLATAATAALELVASPLMAVILAATLLVGTLVAVIGAAVLIIQDLWVALNGGDSVIANVLIKPFKWLGEEIDKVIARVLKFLGLWDLVKDSANSLYMKTTGMNDVSKKQAGQIDENNHRLHELQMLRSADPSRMLSDTALTPSQPTGNNSTVKQENNIDINVNGGSDPYQTGRAIADPLKQAISDAAYQLPVPA